MQTRFCGLTSPRVQCIPRPMAVASCREANRGVGCASAGTEVSLWWGCGGHRKRHTTELESVSVRARPSLLQQIRRCFTTTSNYREQSIHHWTTTYLANLAVRMEHMEVPRQNHERVCEAATEDHGENTHVSLPAHFGHVAEGAPHHGNGFHSDQLTSVEFRGASWDGK